MVLQVVYELCPVHQFGPLRQRRVELCGRHVALVALDVLLVVPAQAVPGGGVEQEGHALQDDGQAHVQVPVGHVVVQHAGAPVAAVSAPEEAGGVDAGAEDQWRRDEACGETPQRVYTRPLTSPLLLIICILIQGQVCNTGRF